MDKKEYDRLRYHKLKNDSEFIKKRKEYHVSRMEDPEYRRKKNENERIRQYNLRELILKQKKIRYESDEEYRKIKINYSQNYRKENRHEIRKKDQIRQKELKQKMINGYGGECKCCGEENIGFLTVDNIHGGGQEHRRKVGTGKAFYLWIIRNNYPDYLQILCYNCNLGRSKNNDICPHDTSIN